MNYSVCLVPRGIRHILSSDIFPTVSKDKHGTGTASIQAGSSILAKGGICFIGELSSHKKDKLEQLQTGRITGTLPYTQSNLPQPGTLRHIDQNPVCV